MGDSKYDFEHGFRNNIRQAISNGEEADSYSSDKHDGEGAAVIYVRNNTLITK